MKYEVKIIHVFCIEAENEFEAEEEALQKCYSEAYDCYLETEKIGE